MPTRKPIVGGNWKMNTDLAAAKSLARAVAEPLGADGTTSRVDVALFPPFPYLMPVLGVLRDTGSSIALGAQDFWPEKNGAFTGEISLEMLVDCGVTIVLVGHSERRHVVKEPETLINAKARAALAAKTPTGPMKCILCIGETIDERRAGQTDAVNERQLRSALQGVTADQLAHLVIAYEPVWAIGTGVNATPEDARSAHASIRKVLASMYSAAAADAIRIQYGGSVKASNAGELFSQPGVDGGLIGGASLKAEEFAAIVRAAGHPAR